MFGSFRTEREAAEAYDRAALHYHGKHARRNFPKKRLLQADGATLRRELRRRTKLDTSSKYRGVTKKRSRWCAAISVGNRPVFLGHWRMEHEAAEAHDRAVRFFGGKADRLNFPRRRLEAKDPAELRTLAYASFKTTTGSRYRGVLFDTDHGRRPWIAVLCGIGPTKKLHLGTWEAEGDAARAYDRAVRHYVGPGARLNFPEQNLEPADAEALMREALREAKRALTSRYVGVSWNSQERRWVAVINHRRRRIHLGFYDNERVAADAYDDKCIELRGPRARINFHPRTGEHVWGTRLRDLIGAG